MEWLDIFPGACSSGCLHAGWSMSGVGVGMCRAYCWLGKLLLAGGEPHSLSSPQTGLKLMQGRAFPCHVAQPQEPKALEGIWAPPISCAIPPCASPLATLSIASSSLAPYPMPREYAVGWGGVSGATSTVVRVWTIGSATTIVAPPMTSLPRTTECTRRVATLSSLSQGSHEPGYLLS